MPLATRTDSTKKFFPLFFSSVKLQSCLAYQASLNVWSEINVCIVGKFIFYTGMESFFYLLWKFLSFVFYSQNENTIFFRVCVFVHMLGSFHIAFKHCGTPSVSIMYTCTHIHTSHTSVSIRNENAFLLSGIAWKTYETTHAHSLACTALSVSVHFATNER